MLNDDENAEEDASMIAALYGESVFQSGVRIEKGGWQSEDVYVDFGYESAEELEKELQARVKETANNGRSKDGRVRLK